MLLAGWEDTDFVCSNRWWTRNNQSIIWIVHENIFTISFFWEKVHAINFWILQTFLFLSLFMRIFCGKLYVFHSNLNLCSLLVTNQYDCISLSFPSLSDPNKLGCNQKCPIGLVLTRTFRIFVSFFINYCQFLFLNSLIHFLKAARMVTF